MRRKLLGTEERLYTPSEAAKALGVKYDTFMHWIYRGKIPVIETREKPIQFIKSYRITQATLDKLRGNNVSPE